MSLWGAWFLFAFLPGVAAVWWLLPRGWRQPRMALLIVASLGFYASWEGWLALLLAGSIVLNWGIARLLRRYHEGRLRMPLWPILAGGIALNLAPLVLWKYAVFVTAMLGIEYTPAAALSHLPLAISFFTFQQIGYLVDITCRFRGFAGGFLDYAAFISFFPQLAAGPIVRAEHFRRALRRALAARHELDRWLIAGLGLIAMGVAKKTALADTFAQMADPLFADVAAATPWLGVKGSVAYTLQIYFDFSGYSDIALGCACLFGVRLPDNFFSPYRSTSLRQFWRRWHITLSTWIRDYLYIPLGGSRLGPARTTVNLLLTMTLCGLWHGAGWTFVLWGALHGAGLVVNRLWQGLGRPLPGPLAWLVTILFVHVGWVLFRAPSLDAALDVLALHAALPAWLGAGFAEMAEIDRLSEFVDLGVIALGVAICAWPRNTLQIAGLGERGPVLTRGRLIWLALLTGACLSVAIWTLTGEARPPTFIYFYF